MNIDLEKMQISNVVKKDPLKSEQKQLEILNNKQLESIKVYGKLVKDSQIDVLV